MNFLKMVLYIIKNYFKKISNENIYFQKKVFINKNLINTKVLFFNNTYKDRVLYRYIYENHKQIWSILHN
jgi:hypothetical protein